MNTFLKPVLKSLKFAVLLLGVLISQIAQAQLSTGESLSFDGSNDYVQLSGDNDFGKVTNFQENFTFEAWVYNDGSNTWARVFDFGDSTNDFIGFSPKSNNNKGAFFYRTGGGFTYILETPSAFPMNVWTHVVCRLESNGRASILLGNENAPDTEVAATLGWPKVNNIFGTTKSYLGKSQYNDPYFKGNMREVRVWKKTRSITDINSTKDCELSGSESDLIAYLKLNQGIVDGDNRNINNIATNFGVLSNDDARLVNFSLLGSGSNWSSNNPLNLSPLVQNAVEFHGNDDHFVLNDEAAFDFEDEYTIEYWAFVNGTDSKFSKAIGKGSQGPSVVHGNGTIHFGQRANTFADYYETTPAYTEETPGVWVARETTNIAFWNTQPSFLKWVVPITINVLGNNIIVGYRFFYYEQTTNTTFFPAVTTLIEADRPDDPQFSVTAAGIPNNKWIHVALTAKEVGSNTRSRIYVDGILRAERTVPTTLITNNDRVSIGKGFAGRMGNIRFWNKEISANQILNNRSTDYPAGTENLVAQYNNYEDYSSGLVDQINGHDGGRANAPVFTTDPCYIKFDSQPQDVMLANLENGQINLSASIAYCRDDNYSFQWFRNGSPISGETGLTYSKTSELMTNDLGIYTLRVTACGSEYFSNRATVTVANQGQVLHFDGVDDHVTVDFPFSDDTYTIEATVMFDDSPTDMNIIALGDDTKSYEDFYSHQLCVNKDGYFEHKTYDQGNIGPNGVSSEIKAVTHPENIKPNKWYNVVGKFAAGQMTIIVNAVPGETRSVSTNVLDGGNDWIIGAPAGGCKSFKGKIDDIKVWNIDQATLNQEEIVTANAALSLYLKFNEGIGGADNTNPAVDMVIDPFSNSPVREGILHNFALIGETSNWLDCDAFENDYTFSISDEYINLGDDLSFDAGITGAGDTETYQWYKDGKPLTDQINQELLIEKIQPSDEGAYNIKVNSISGCDAFSETADIMVDGTGEVLHFDGIDDYITFGNNATSDIDYSIEMWVKFEDDVASQNIIASVGDKGINTEYSQQLFTDANGFLNHSTRSNSGIIYTAKSDAPLLPNQWYHISAITIVDNITLGINGEAQNQSTPVIGGHVSFSKYYVGHAGTGQDGSGKFLLDAFKGEMEELKIYSTYRDLSVVLADMNTELTYDATVTGLEHYFRFNQGLASGDNSTNGDIRLLDFGPSPVVAQVGNATMHNFQLTGSTSNFKDCSPITTPVLSYAYDQNPILVGDDLIIDLDILQGDTSVIDYQWRFDGTDIPGETSPLLTKENVALADFGIYDVIVQDQCTPQYLDTLSLGELQTQCYTSFVHQTIDPNMDSTYVFCSTFESISGPCPPNSFNINGGYCNSEASYVGLENVFQLTLTSSKVVNLSLSNIESEVDLWIYGDDCNLDNCIAASTNLAQEDEFIEVLLEAGDYYIIADEMDEDETENGGSDSLLLEVILIDSKCQFSTPLACGDEISGTTVGGTEFISSLCGDDEYSSAERIYEITLTEEKALLFSITNMSTDHDIFLLDGSCQESNCVASSTFDGLESDNILYAAEAGTYYLVVNGKTEDGTFDLSLNCNEIFSASQLTSDAYVELAWTIDKALHLPQDTGVVVKVFGSPNDLVYEEEYFTAAQIPPILVGSYKDYIGPDASRNYIFRIFNRLTNEIVYQGPATGAKVGSTTSFQMPEIISVSQGESPLQIELEWRNHSDLSDNFNLYRDGIQITSLFDGYTQDSLIVTYADVHDINQVNSLQSGSTVSYDIETFSTQLNQAYPSVSATGSTYDVDFTASDDLQATEITLDWNDISAFCQNIIVKREGIILKVLAGTSTTFVDDDPLKGYPVEYSITLLSDGEELMEIEDQGAVAADGAISGRVISEENGIPVENVKIVLAKNLLATSGQDSLVNIDSIFTDIQGRYTFGDLVYGLTQNFTVTASKAGSSFSDSPRIVTLSEVTRQLTDVDFIDETELLFDDAAALINDLNADEITGEDKVGVTWDYTYSNTDTLFFSLYRDGELLLYENDADGKIDSYLDVSGFPNTNYIYTLQVAQKQTAEIDFQTLKDTIDYPAVNPISGFDYVLGDPSATADVQAVDPQIFFSWNANAAQNISGYRIFEGTRLLGEVDKNITTYTHTAIPGETAGYSIRTYRAIDETSIESVAYPAGNDSLITANQLWLPSASLATSGDLSGPRAIGIRGDAGAGTYNSLFYQNANYDGLLIERKESIEGDSTYMPIASFTKDYIVNQIDNYGDVISWDADMVPNTDYDYRISTFITIDDALYKNGVVTSRTGPAVEPPTNLMTTNNEGKVILNWLDHSQLFDADNKMFLNYDGIEVTRENTTQFLPEELLADLPILTQSYSDYVTNPVYDLFSELDVDVAYKYGVRSYTLVDGVRYYSDAEFANGSPTSISSDEPIPTEFVASTDIPSHIKLCWEWTTPKQSTFLLYRDTIQIAELPFTARAYYDYDAPADPSVEYRIISRHSGNESASAYAEGRRSGITLDLYGRVENAISATGVPGVNLRYYNKADALLEVAEGQYSGIIETDITGNYQFDDIPYIQDMKVYIEASSDMADFDPLPANGATLNYSGFAMDSITIANETAIQINFLDYSEIINTVSVTPIAGVVATPNVSDMSVVITWSPQNGNYDGFRIKRVNVTVGEVMKGEPLSITDVGGFPGIDYTYGVEAFIDTPEGRVYSDMGLATTTFPAILPVENLTATAFFNQNKMLVSWSHPLDDHDSYRVRRNGVFMESIPTGEQMMWYDTTGIPGIEYQYELVAVKGNNISQPTVVVQNYKGVGEVTSLSTFIDESVQSCTGTVTNANNVTILWEYLDGAADGFNIYRDGELIASVQDTFLNFGSRPNEQGDVIFENGFGAYQDYSGAPGTVHEYYVLAYVDREGTRYESGVEELYLKLDETFPQLAEVKSLDVGINDDLGTVQVLFDYEQFIAKGFIILKDGIPLDTILQDNSESFVYQDFSGSPGEINEYSVRVYDVRDGVTYFSATNCSEILEFPSVPVPQNLSASKGDFFNYIELDWQFELEAFVDSFHLENVTLGETTSYPSGRRKHVDVVNNNLDPSYFYRIRASRVTPITTIYSDWSEEVEGWAQIQRTGTEIVDVDGQSTAGFNGGDVAIDGEWAVSGAKDGEEAIIIYRRVNGGWSEFQVVPSPLVGEDYDFGHAVAISGERIVVGAPEFPTYGKIYVYKFDGNQWANPQEITSPGPGNFGWSVDIDETDIIVGNPEWDGNNRGAIYWYEEVDGIWISNGGLGSSTLASNRKYFGSSVAIENGRAFALWTESAGAWSEIIEYIKDSNGDWVFEEAYNQIYTLSADESILRDRLDFADGYITVGDSWNDDSGTNAGKVVIINTNTNPYVVNTITPPDINNFQLFGSKVSFATIPSPVVDAHYLLASSPGFDEGNDASGYDSGRAYLFSDRSGSWQLMKSYINDPFEGFARLGEGIALSKDALIIGTPRAGDLDRGEVLIENLIEAPLTVSATDGVSLDNDETETTISWTFSGDPELTAGFNIYRDDVFLTFRSIETAEEVNPGILADSWNDNTGLRGKRFVYTVKSVNNLIPFESYGASDEGNNTPDATIQGSVVTAIGSIGVPGVSISARAVVEDEVYEYETTTFPDGTYIISDVFYDHDPLVATDYTVSASFLDHVINATPDDVTTLNSVADPVSGIVNFIDQTAFVIKGHISQPLVNCDIEGVEVVPVINGEEDFFGMTTTDAFGNYSLVINPNEVGLTSLTVRIKDTYILEEDTLKATWIPDADTTYTDFVNFPQITEVNFEDATTYPVLLRVKNTCGDPITNGKWDVRLFTLDGCFDETFQTSTTGDLNLDLLPLNYVMSVEDVDSPSSLTAQALAYYANFPQELDLRDLHKDKLYEKTAFEISELVDRQFTFHVAPEIEIVGFSEFFCDTPVAITKQGDEYTLNLNVLEEHNGEYCSVSEGKISISNPASGIDTVIVYDTEAETFPPYTFTALAPNEVAPHIFSVTFDYLSDDDNFLGRKILGVFVEGEVLQSGTNVIVDPSDDDGSVPMPIMVLRDPPGDGSSSYISGGQTINYSTSFENTLGGSGAIFANAKANVLGISAGLGMEFKMGGSQTTTGELTSEITISQTISTDSGDSFIGEDADIVIGEGLVMSYGNLLKYSVGNCDTIKVVGSISISPNPISTTWSYTVKQLKDIITGFENDLVRIQIGTKEITENGEVLPKEKALEKVNTYLNNWQQVLAYHDINTKPHYQICAGYPKPVETLFPAQKTAIDEWKAELCPVLGTGIDESFVLFDDLVWNNDLIDLYNAAAISIRNIADVPIENSLAVVEFIKPLTGPVTDVLGGTTYQSQVVDYGPPVSNITTGGNIEISNSFNNVNASTTTNSSSYYFSNESSVALNLGKDLKIFVGGFAGAGVGAFVGGTAGIIETVFELEAQAGVKAEFNMNQSSSFSSNITNTVETGFTLFDDDTQDQFSVAVIHPMNQNQTPYFELFGGFTSCPPEPGAIAIDNPKMALVYGTGTSSVQEQNFVDPSGPAVYTLRVDNQTNLPSLPTRELTISLDPSTNQFGAIVKVNNVSLNNGNLTLPFDAFDPTDLTVTVEQVGDVYSYPDLAISVEPSCGGGPVDTVYLTTNFTSPCSPVSLIAPIDNWVRNDNTPLQIGIQDYDTTNVNLTNASLEVRRIGAGDNWKLINPQELQLSNPVPLSELADNDATYPAGQTPMYTYTWNIPTGEGSFADGFYPDGEYELRVVMACNTISSFTYSNVITGTIARDGLKLFGSPEPADQLWTSGDEISFTFNKDLDCGLIDPAFIADNMSIIREETGEELPFTVGCYENKLIYVLDQPMSDFDGEFLILNVSNVPSLNGNISEEHEWRFRVVTEQLYWNEGDTIRLQMYADDTYSLNARIENNTGNQIINGVSIDTANFESWISLVTPSSLPFSVTPVGEDVTLEITANQAVGTYLQDVDFTTVSGDTASLHILLDVLKTPPNWVVDPSGFNSSMEIVSNWRFTEEDEAFRSTETTDIISVWMDGEIRGVANIEKAGNFYAAYITVLGNPEDVTSGIPLEFRIWDADPGIEYDGFPVTGDTIYYTIGQIRGTAVNPEMLEVDPEKDKARYIYLRENDWTGFSLNTETDNMEIMHKLRTLKSVTENDMIVTQDKFSVYSDSLGWYSFGTAELTDISLDEGYMIYLENGPDTLRITGALQTSPPDISLWKGWNWIGYPYDSDQLIDGVFDVNNMNGASGTANGLDKIIRGNGQPDDISIDFADYNIGTDMWNGSLTEMKPYDLHKLYTAHPEAANLTWTSENLVGDQNEMQAKMSVPDPNDVFTWTLPDYGTEEVMPIIADVEVAGQIMTDPLDKVLFFHDDTIRGYGTIHLIPELNTHALTIVAKQLPPNVDYDIRYYDASEGVIMTAINEVEFDMNGLGTLLDPYTLIFEVDPCPDELIIGPSGDPFILDKTFEARQTIRVKGMLNVPTGVEIILSAPQVILEDQLDTQTGSNVIIRPDGCN